MEFPSVTHNTEQNTPANTSRICVWLLVSVDSVYLCACGAFQSACECKCLCLQRLGILQIFTPRERNR